MLFQIIINFNQLIMGSGGSGIGLGRAIKDVTSSFSGTGIGESLKKIGKELIPGSGTGIGESFKDRTNISPSSEGAVDRGNAAQATASRAAEAERKRVAAETKRLQGEESAKVQKEKARRRTTFAGREVEDTRPGLFGKTLSGGPQRRSILGG